MKLSLLLLSYNRLSRKPRLFKSFTGLSVKQFDDVFKEIESKYPKYEIKRLSTKRKYRRERAVGGGRRFKLVIEDRIILVLVYYRLYITYTLTGFLFDLDQSNVCRDIEKIESLIRECLPIPQKLYNVTKRLKSIEDVEAYFPGFIAFETVLNSKYQGQRLRKEGGYTTLEREKNTLSRTYTQQIRRA